MNYPNFWVHSADSENPDFAFLGGADIILITEESTNMLTEAAGTGKPIFSLPLSGRPEKFAQLHSALSKHSNLKPFTGNPKAPDYPPLVETARMAERLWAHFDRRDAVLN